MLSTSKDLLNIILTFAILWLTVFLCWALFYLVQILRQVHETLKIFRDKVEEVHKIFLSFKDKFEHSLLSLSFISEAVKTILELIKERRLRKKK